MRIASIFTLLFILTIVTHKATAEGTKELIPNAADSNKLVLVLSKGLQNNNEYGYFATPQADADNRLWVTISTAGEKVFFGFKKVNATKTISWAIKNAAGVVQASGNIPNSGNGYIPSYNKTIIGPNSISVGGYNPLSHTFSLPGDYYFEFDYSVSGWFPQDEKLLYFDITVTTASNTRINGRVWSKNWFLSTEGGSDYNFYGSLYSYSDDQIVTKIDFNGMGPYFFRVSCNPTGCANTGNFVEDQSCPK